jgi:hypothetical protein
MKIFALMLVCAPAQAADIDFSAFLTNRANIRAGFRDTTMLINPETLRYDTQSYLGAQSLDPYYSGFIELGANARFNDWLTAKLWLNSGEVRQQAVSLDGSSLLQTIWTANGRELGSEAANTLFIRQALLDFHDPDTQWWAARAGRKLWRVGDSLIYDDYGLGANLDLDFNLRQGVPLRMSATYIVPSRDWTDLPLQSPLVSVTADYVLSLFDDIAFSLTYFHDGAGELTETLRQSFVENALDATAPARMPAAFDTEQQEALYCYLNADFSSRADLFYGTLSAHKALGPGTFSGAVVFSGGPVSVIGSPVLANGCKPTAKTQLVSFDTFAAAANLGYEWRLTPKLRLTPFFVLESGDAPRSGGAYHAYIGVVPYITRTFLFFGGGLSETFGARNVVAAGVNGRGVIAPGLDATYDPWPALRMRGIAAPLFSFADGIAPPVGGGGRFYGMELDSLIDYRPWPYLGLVAEGDVIITGSFYRSQEPVWKFIAGVDLFGAWHL